MQPISKAHVLTEALKVFLPVATIAVVAFGYRSGAAICLLTLVAVGSLAHGWRLAQHSQHLKTIEQERERFKQIVDNTWDIIWETDAEGHVSYVNPRIFAILGFSRTEIMGEIPFDLTPLLRAVKDGSSPFPRAAGYFHWEHSETHKLGHTIWLHSTGSAIIDGKDHFIGMRGITRDISERVRHERDLKQAQQLAEQGSKSKSEFLARMSHEIRTPMNAIIGMCHLALRTPLTPMQQDYVTKIRLSANTLLGIINDILDFSKIEAGKLDIAPHPFSLSTLLDGVLNIVSLAAEDKQLELLLALDPAVPVGLHGDSLRLGQVLINLTNNAIKFTDEGEVVLSVSMVSQTKDSVTLHFSVHDTGIGIAEEHMTHLFSPFTQADGSTTREHGGTGLGLSISHKLVTLLGGTLTCTSTPNEGSEFSFTLTFPLAQIQEVLLPEPPLPHKKHRVLVVDDNAIARHSFAETLRSFGLQTDTASCASEAIRMVRKATPPYDMALVDWQMPAMNGVQLIHAIRELSSLHTLPRFVIVTAYGRNEVLRRIRTEQIDALLLKPVSSSALFNTVLKTLHIVAPSLSERILPIAYPVPPHIMGARILLAEDNEFNQQVALELLEKSGLHAVLARNGTEAVMLAQTQEFQAILMDIQMPEMDGLEATRQIRATPRLQGVPIIAMTAHALTTDREISLQTGMNDHLNKPVEPEELFRVLGKWIPNGGWTPHHISLPVVNTISDQPLPSSERIHVEDGLWRVRGNKRLYSRLLNDFADEYATISERIRHCLKHDKHDTAFRLAHTLKGVSGNIGAITVHDAVSVISDSIREGHEVTDSQLHALRTAMRETIGAITELMPALASPPQTEPLPGDASAAQATSAPNHTGHPDHTDQTSHSTAPSSAASDATDQQAARGTDSAAGSGKENAGMTDINTDEAVSTPEQAPKSAPLSKPALLANLRRLESLIRIQDMQSLTLLEELSPTLASYAPEQTQQINRALSGFAFKTAASRLAHIMTILEAEKE